MLKAPSLSSSKSAKWAVRSIEGWSKGFVGHRCHKAFKRRSLVRYRLRFLSKAKGSQLPNSLTI